MLIALTQIAKGSKVMAHVASAVLNFIESYTPDILTPYSGGIVSKLPILLQNGNRTVQEKALTSLVSVAISSQEKFQKYYDVVMPYLKVVQVNITDNCTLLAKMMECISLVVGKENFFSTMSSTMPLSHGETLSLV
ncbi:hypothetical protein VNO77_27577 [Canavalia gladiata]|uniref:Uncharacterized protein n=2 Tax=Canavalia gladiata TaxID=3824 RepID=A0AAN9KU95_CANGL